MAQKVASIWSSSSGKEVPDEPFLTERSGKTLTTQAPSKLLVDVGAWAGASFQIPPARA